MLPFSPLNTAPQGLPGASGEAALAPEPTDEVVENNEFLTTLQGLPVPPLAGADGAVARRASTAAPALAAAGTGTVLPPGGQPLPSAALAASLSVAGAGAGAAMPVAHSAGAQHVGIAASVGHAAAPASLPPAAPDAAVPAAGADTGTVVAQAPGMPQGAGMWGASEVGTGSQGAGFVPSAAPAFAAGAASNLAPFALQSPVQNAPGPAPLTVDATALAAEAAAPGGDADGAPELQSAGLSPRPVTMAPGATGAPGAMAAPVLTLARADFQPQLGERVAWMMSQGLQRAELQIDPPHLGRVDVTIVMRGEQAQLAFTADTGSGRELLESALPKLRDTLQEAGITLADVNVSARGHDAHAHADGADTRNEAAEAEAIATPAQPVSISAGTTLLDLYA